MNNKDIRVLLVDDHAIVRCGIKSLIDGTKDMSVCGESDCLTDAYDKVANLNPDIVLLDIKLPDGDGVVGCGRIKKISPKTKVIILTAYTDETLVMEAIKANVDGYLLKNIDSKSIISAISNTFHGKTILDPTIIDNVLNLIKKENDKDDLFSKQEKKILELVSIGKTNKEISKELFIAEKTVRNYVSKIMKKIGVNNRTEAAIYWAKLQKLN